MEINPPDSTIRKDMLYWSFLGLVFFTVALPITSLLGPWFDPPGWGSTLLFRGAFTLFLLFLAFHVLVRKRGQILQEGFNIVKRRNTPLQFLFGFLVLGFLATLFSLDITFSLWGNPYRSGGSVNLFFYILLALSSFLLIRSCDWKKVWNVAIFFGILIAVISLLQRFAVFETFFHADPTRITGTLGSPSLLGVYFLLLFFPTLSYALQREKFPLRAYYSTALFLFAIVILLTISQAAYLGLGIGLIYFFLFYPRISLRLKLIGRGVLAIALAAILFIPIILPGNPIFEHRIARDISRVAIDQSRLSAWQISLRAIQDRPFLGYGPENFAIGFDQYYDPSLPNIQKQPGGTLAGWWDRAHNIFLEIAVTMGIPAMIAYIGLLVSLFWSLEKLKKQNHTLRLAAHTIQSALLAYLTANFFGFDSFSSYILFFLLIGQGLHLVTASFKDGGAWQFSFSLPKTKYIAPSAFAALVIVGGIFLWQFHALPLQAAAHLNLGEFLSDTKQCESASPLLEQGLELSDGLFLEAYARRTYMESLRQCEQEGSLVEKYALVQKEYELLKGAAELQPNHTRTWIALAALSRQLFEAHLNDISLPPDVHVENLKKENAEYLEKARVLSPQREDIHIEQARMHLVQGNYQDARDTAQQCISANSQIALCWWLLARAQISLGNIAQGEAAFKQGLQLPREALQVSLELLLKLGDAYTIAQEYEKLVEVREQLIAIDDDVPDYFALLAAAYRQIGEYEKARQAALRVLELNPKLQADVDAFLNTLQ